MAVLAAFGIFIVIENLTTPGDATQTAIAITNAESLFRLGIVSLVSVAILDVDGHCFAFLNL